METREEAFKDWKKGMKYKDIAEKYEVSLSAVKSWATRYWKAKKVATKKQKKLQQRPMGPPKGNRNAAGNSGGGAPPRNQNRQVHGAYSQVYWDTLDETELQLIEDIRQEEEHQLHEQLKLFTVRERRLMMRIKEYQKIGEISKGFAIKSIRKERTVSERKDSGKTCKLEDARTVTETESIMTSIMALEQELTKVQRAKTKCIDSLSKLHIEQEKLQLERDKQSDEIEDLSEVEEDIYG